jgi:hypothetical protein
MICCRLVVPTSRTAGGLTGNYSQKMLVAGIWQIHALLRAAVAA